MAKHKSYYCKSCQKNILFIQDSPNHALHIILSIFTAGLWLIVWFFVAIGEKDWHCSVCGSKPTGSGWGIAGDIYRNLLENQHSSEIESRQMLLQDKEKLPRADDDYEKKCSSCAETIKLEALKCKHCGEVFSQDDINILKIEREKREADRKENIRNSYKLIEDRRGEAFCINCRTISSINGMYHHKQTDTYYHKKCLPNEIFS